MMVCCGDFPIPLRLCICTSDLIFHLSIHWSLLSSSQISDPGAGHGKPKISAACFVPLGTRSTNQCLSGFVFGAVHSYPPNNIIIFY